MLTYSFKGGRLPSVWLLSATLAACGASDLDSSPQSTGDGSTADDIVAASGGDDLMPSDASARCGDGRVDANEDCEIGLPGWTRSNCNASCRQTSYPNSNPCTFEIMTDPFTFYGQGNCPDLPGFSEGCFYLFGQGCVVLCNDTEDCPIGFMCRPQSNPTALGPGWCARL